MKNKKIFTIVLSLVSMLTFSQIGLTNPANSTEVYGSNVFLDASTNYSTEAGMPNNQGKGIIIPSVNLVNFEFDLTLADGITFPTYFDGMIVYNNASNTTLITGNRSSTSTAVTPGFYYFSNPNGAANGNVTSGVWKPVGSDSLKNIGTTEIATSTSIDGKQVYAIKGEFTTLGINALVSVIKPAGMTGYYKMTTFIGGKTFRSDISEFKMNPTVLNTDNVVTGNGLFFEVYPEGTYSYTLEYFK